jgi:uncharacterized membrane protein YhaH (DUF805 family)
MSWYIKCLKNYVGFSGRARRKEFWMFFLFNFIFSIAAAIIDQIIFRDSNLRLFSSLYSLAVLLPSLAVDVRRLHDTNRSGFWVFLALIPLVGAIILIVWFATEGQRSENKYGPDPKAQEAISTPITTGVQ